NYSYGYTADGAEGRALIRNKLHRQELEAEFLCLCVEFRALAVLGSALLLLEKTVASCSPLVRNHVVCGILSRSLREIAKQRFHSIIIGTFRERLAMEKGLSPARSSDN